MSANKEVVITFEMPGCPEGCFSVSKELGTPNWFLHKDPLPEQGHPITGEEASAIMALAVGEIESNPEANKALYAIAEPVFGRLPHDTRVIP